MAHLAALHRGRLFTKAATLARGPTLSFRSKHGHSQKQPYIAYGAYSKGKLGTPDFMLYLKGLKSGGRAHDVSPWHQIPCFPDQPEFGLCSFVNEIPLGTRAKMECSLDKPLNPIMQDIKDGKLREFTYGDIPFNYGFIPQTWESPFVTCEYTELNGDNDPLDVVELSGEPMGMGEVADVKILGSFALKDEGEADWKIIALRVTHPLAEQVHDLEHVEKHFPGALATIHDWFKMYKTTDGKPENEFAFDGKPQNADFTCKVINTHHNQWYNMPDELKQKYHRNNI